MDRRTAPVLIVGSPRSGTTWLHHLLQSADGFVYFRTENHLFTALTPRFGRLDSTRKREAFVTFWLGSEHFRLTGLEADAIRDRVTNRVRTAADFLDLVMQLMAERQGAIRWVDSTPGHALHLPEVRRDLPGALVIHVIRDGRDTALSMARQQWVRPLPGDRGGLLGAAANWAWHVRRAQHDGRDFGDRYLEIRYESLVQDIRGTLECVGRFLECTLDYDTICRHPVGSVATPNSSYGHAAGHSIGRWKREAEGAVRRLEAVLAADLARLGYARTWPGRAGMGDRALWAAYLSRQRLGVLLKRHTPLARRASLGLFERSAAPIPESKLWWPDDRHRQATSGEGLDLWTVRRR